MKTKSKIISKRRFKAILITVSAICAVFIIFGIISVSIFTGSLQAQRTIAAYDTEGDRFSSNVLLKGESKENVRTVYTTSISPLYTVMTVCNYQQGMQTLPYPDAFEYTLTARLVRYDDNEAAKYIPVNSEYITLKETYYGLNADEHFTVTISNGTDTITLNKSNLSDSFSDVSFAEPTASGESHGYTISFSANFVEHKPDLYLELIAVPSIEQLPTLRGIVKPDLRAAGASNLWTGAFRDDNTVNPQSYDGYNYLITGTGSGNVTITWDTTKVVLSDVSKDMLLSISGATQTGSSITFHVNSDDESRYDLQFYKVNISDGTTWANMNSFVVFSFS